MTRPDLTTLPLGALRGFDAAVRLESFTLAARELHVTHGAVSRQIRSLEQDVGARLFERRNRRVFATAAGKSLHRHVRAALEALAEGLRELRGAAERPLVVSCEPTLTRQWLIPRLAAQAQRAEAITLEVSVAGGLPAFTRGTDVAIRRADFPVPPSLHATPLMEEWVGPVCRPSVAEQRGRPVKVHTASRLDAWTTWEELGGARVRSSREISFEHFWLSIEAAVAGLGYTMGPYPLVEQELASGRLVAPHGFLRGPCGYVALTPTRPNEDPRVERFLAWVRAEARAMDRRRRALVPPKPR